MINLNVILKNFEIIPSDNAYEILLENMNKFKNEDNKTLYLVAGPNGSGKSTLIANLYKNEQIKANYINADIYVRTIFKYLPTEKERNYRAMFHTMDLIKKCASSYKPIIYETVLSHPSKLDIVRQFKDNGFKIFSIFISPNNPYINVERVATRVQEGGHNVPNEKIVERFYRSHKLKESLKSLSDEYCEIDNSQMPRIIDYKGDQQENS